jgi:hypothetical protein
MPRILSILISAALLLCAGLLLAMAYESHPFQGLLALASARTRAVAT